MQPFDIVLQVAGATSEGGVPYGLVALLMAGYPPLATYCWWLSRSREETNKAIQAELKATKEMLIEELRARRKERAG